MKAYSRVPRLSDTRYSRVPRLSIPVTRRVKGYTIAVVTRRVKGYTRFV